MKVRPSRPSLVLVQRARSECARTGKGRVLARPGRAGEKERAVQDSLSVLEVEWVKKKTKKKLL